MNVRQIELWALKVIERVKAVQPIEDCTVELKSRWPEDIPKAARQIAAHANAAHGQPILWLIGVDEKAHVIPGAGAIEVSSWYQQVKAEFDERFAPQVTNLDIPCDGKTVVALCFDTERSPFVIKAPNDRLEVPWREGTATRSAKRSELLKLLLPLQYAPRFEVLTGGAVIHQARSGEVLFDVWAQVYIEPCGDSPLVIPFHRCKASIQASSSSLCRDLMGARFHLGSEGKMNLSKTMEATGDELLAYGPGKAGFRAGLKLEDASYYPGDTIELHVSVLPGGAEDAVSFVASLIKSGISATEKDLLHQWVLAGSSAKSIGS